MFGFVLLVILGAFGVAYYSLYRYITRVPDDVVHNNIYLGNADVSGMKKAEAEESVRQQMEDYGERVITLTVDGDPVETTLADLGLNVKSLDQYVKEALKYGKEGSLGKRYRRIRKLKEQKKKIEMTYIIDEERANAFIKEKAVPLQQGAVNATIVRENGSFIYTDEKQGRKINVEKTIVALKDFLNKDWNFKNGEIAAKMEVDEPTVTKAHLESIQDVLGSFYTYGGSGDRLNNLRKGAELVNGTMMMPGEEISVQNITGPYTVENGYYEATAYENGQVVPSIGGGICQVSTTLYNAVLYAELEVTQRAPHSMLVDYVKPSRDAAIAGDYKDLKFKNNQEAPIYIESYIDGEGKLYMVIYGKESRDPGRTVEYVSKTLERSPAPEETKYVANKDKSIGYMTQTTNPYEGVEAQLVKIVTVNGETTEEDVANTSSYNSASAVVTVGTGSSNPNAVEVVKNAIATQNREKIEAAIEQAKGMGE